MDWQNKFDQEIQMAQDVRARGNEAQSRVCARRAAGIVLREYFTRRRVPVTSSSAYDLLKQLVELPGVPERLRMAAEYLTLRVTEEFTLPVVIDLIDEARLLAENLLQDPGAG